MRGNACLPTALNFWAPCATTRIRRNSGRKSPCRSLGHRRSRPHAANDAIGLPSAVDCFRRASCGDDAREQERTLEPTPAVTAAAAEAGRLADSIEAGDGLALG